MEPAVVAALLAAVASLIVSLVNGAWGSRTQRKLAALREEYDRRTAAEHRELQTEEILARYREPLVSAAFDLQSRLYNILEQDFLEAYARSDSGRRVTALKTSLFRFAQYFGWVEILREEIQFLKFSDVKDTRAVSMLLAHVGQIFVTDQLDQRRFMLWRDEQRALGELMIDREGPLARCIGYARFVAEYEKTFAYWCEQLEEELLSGEASRSTRLQLAQHKLCDLVEQLDKDVRRYRFSRAAKPLSIQDAEALIGRIFSGPVETVDTVRPPASSSGNVVLDATDG